MYHYPLKAQEVSTQQQQEIRLLAVHCAVTAQHEKIGTFKKTKSYIHS